MTYPRPGVPVRGSTSGRQIMALLDILGRRWVLRIFWELRGRETEKLSGAPGLVRHGLPYGIK